jgi:hypothetical protein
MLPVIRSRTVMCVMLLTSLTILNPDRASASSIVSFGSDTGVLSGNLPGTPGTYVQALFENTADDGAIASNTVRLTLTVPTSEAGLFVDEIGFNFNSDVAPVFTHLSGVQASSGPAFDPSGIAVNGTGNEKFNASFPFPNPAAARLEAPKSSVYTITGLQFGSDLSLLLKANSNGYLAATHIAGFAQGSAGIAGQVVTPEPGTLAMAALILVPLGVLRVTRFRRARVER